MGKVEQSAKIQRKKNYIQQALLATLATSGALALAAVAPAVLLAIGMIARQTGYKVGYRARTAAGRLAQKGLLRFVERDGRTWIEITEKGRRIVELETRKAAGGKKPKRWDKRFRLVMFDIPEKRKQVRKRLGQMMREFGFLRIQDSVWVYPYDCEELVTLIKAELQIGKAVLYAVVESIENDGWIKKHFSL